MSQTFQQPEPHGESVADPFGINGGSVKAEAPTARHRRVNGAATIQPMLTVEDIANVMQVHPRTIQRWCRERRVPHIRIGRKIRFTPAQLDEIAQAYTREKDTGGSTDVPNPVYRERPVVVPMKVAPAT